MESANNRKPFRVFVSSSFKDLYKERQALGQALHQMRDTELIAMEYFGSRPDTPKDVCLQEVRRCQVYIGIFGRRYGSIDSESNLSMTELEYREAYRGGLPCLIYLRDDCLAVKEEDEEIAAESIEKLAALKQELQRHHVVTVFQTSEQLVTKVILDLHNLITAQSPQSVQPMTTTRLYNLLTTRFDLEELKTLCMDLGIDFDDLRGEGKLAKIRELLSYLERRKALSSLTVAIARSRPDIVWD